MSYPVPPPEKQFPLRNYKANNPKFFDQGILLATNTSPKSILASCSSSSSASSAASSRSNSPTNVTGDERPQTPATPVISTDKLPSTKACPTTPPRIVHPKPQSLQRVPKGNCPASTPAALVQSLPTAGSGDFDYQEEYLTFLEPSPVSPPSYDTLPPGGCPKYPVMSPLSHEISVDEPIPEYSPTIYKIGLVSRKSEWISPYEPSTGRSWKNMIIELNSTQLNFYSIPAHMEAHVIQFWNWSNSSPESSGYSPYSENEPTCPKNDATEFTLRSDLTLDQDLEFYRFLSRLGITSSASPTNKNLFRTYTLQHSRLGLATDYKKKQNVMRIRVESEQLLLEFPDTKSLIDWNFALGIGKDVAIDIQDREIPKYRTVPRRRRHRDRERRNTTSNDGRTEFFPASAGRDQSNLNVGALSTGRKRAQSESLMTNGENSIKSRLIKIKSRFSLSSSSSPSNSNASISASSSFSTISSLVDTLPEIERERQSDVGRPTFSVDYDDVLDETDEGGDDSEVMENEYGNELGDEDLDEDDELVDENGDLGDDSEENIDLDDYKEEIENPNMGEGLQLSPNSPSSPQGIINAPSTLTGSSKKWNPLAKSKQPSLSKHYKNCIRCIKPLTAEDLWVGKVLVKPTTLSPLNMSYLRNIKYGNSSSSKLSPSSSSTSLVSLSSGSTGVMGGGYRKRSFSIKDIPHFDASLPRTPNHFLKEFTVGSHGLIPKTV
ncbi:hypothetical protein CLIB1423_17S00254 [[Candida] railenensis]|uniref:PH domain-containing protein n=1 Tax=[Candida] railenensis TaxID=45579 RepID=A0A9P0QTW9_9ASCO|nr:hypothetical protein CLIB1423_17S00254 [[Candida] railenensis]